MKTMTRFTTYLPIATMILSAALAGPAAAQNRLPLNGALHGTDSDAPGPTPTTLIVTTTGTALGSLGQLSFTQTATVDLAAGTDSGPAHWILANGDTIETTFAGSGEETQIPNVIRITEVHTIIGGTGRCEGIKGSFTVERFANVVTFVTSGSFHGTIIPAGTGR